MVAELELAQRRFFIYRRQHRFEGCCFAASLGPCLPVHCPFGSGQGRLADGLGRDRTVHEQVGQQRLGLVAGEVRVSMELP
jgi:hypothetical protein